MLPANLTGSFAKAKHRQKYVLYCDSFASFNIYSNLTLSTMYKIIAYGLKFKKILEEQMYTAKFSDFLLYTVPGFFLYTIHLSFLIRTGFKFDEFIQTYFSIIASSTLPIEFYIIKISVITHFSKIFFTSFSI